uniref:Neurotransmitter-gated ion-channel ligand-binding domain-containing protein n=1 Tax=Plectus sambesii TaxID=2011161 RepID=A0A914VAI3_9BILA
MLMALRSKYHRHSSFWYTFLIIAVSSVFADELGVYEAILTNYNKNMLPVKNFSTPMVISVELTSFQLLYMDQIQETITFVTIVNMIWKDENLRWNASEFGGTSSVVILYSLLWKPDIIVNSGLSINNLHPPDEQRYVRVQSDGNVELFSLCVITNTCRMSIEDFPYDTQTCNISLESWTYTAHQIGLVIGQRRGNLNGTFDDDYFLTIRIASLNVGSMTGRGQELADILKKRKMHIACVQEVRWKGEKLRDIGAGYKLLYYGTTTK